MTRWACEYHSCFEHNLHIDKCVCTELAWPILCVERRFCVLSKIPKNDNPSNVGPYLSDLDETVGKKQREDMPRGPCHGPEARKHKTNIVVTDARKLQNQVVVTIYCQRLYTHLLCTHSLMFTRGLVGDYTSSMTRLAMLNSHPHPRNRQIIKYAEHIQNICRQYAKQLWTYHTNTIIILCE
jgi:hypothetical protein